MPLPPPITEEARQAALAKAAEAKRVRVEIKQRLKAGDLTLSQLLSEADDDVITARTKVLPLLESLPGVGKVKARRTMESIGISENRRLQGLGSKQRSELVRFFG